MMGAVSTGSTEQGCRPPHAPSALAVDPSAGARWVRADLVGTAVFAVVIAVGIPVA